MSEASSHHSHIEEEPHEVGLNLDVPHDHSPMMLQAMGFHPMFRLYVYLQWKHYIDSKEDESQRVPFVDSKLYDHIWCILHTHYARVTHFRLAQHL
jgi:hypothetical protein